MRLLCLMIITAAGCMAAQSTPGGAAIDFLEMVRQGKLNLDPGKGTAISPHVREPKRLSIAARLKRLSQDLGSGELVVGREKVEGDLAGVLVWKADGFDPSQMQVFPVGLVQRNGKWVAAPVPASFENCGIGYRAEIRERVESLESWMLKGQVQDLSRLRDQSIARMRRSIEQHLTRKTLEAMEPREVLERFLKACRDRNPHEIMGLVGGLSSKLPDNWPIRAGCIEEATRKGHPAGMWRMLMSPNVLRITVDMDDDYGPLHASIACLDPHGIPDAGKRKPRIELIHIKLERTSDDLWRVEVPQAFWQQPGEESTTNDELDRDLLDRFATEIRRKYPALPRPDAVKARDALLDALRGSRFTELLQVTEIPDDPLQGRMAILRAAEAWGSLHTLDGGDQPASAHHLINLAMEVMEDEAGVLVHAFSARKPDRFDPHALYLRNSSKGWLWTPNPSEETLGDFQKWSDQATMENQQAWRQKILDPCPVIENLDDRAVSDEEARQVITAWIKAIESGDILSGLAQCALLNGEDSAKTLLRNLGYEVVDALRKEGKGVIRHVIREGPWVGVGTNPRNPETRAYSMYPVVRTPKGPRILLEIDLIASSGRGREFLNRTSLNRVNKLGEKATTQLTDLFREHCRKCLPQP